MKDGMPYRLKADPTSRSVTFDQFKAGTQVANILSTVAYLDVPLSHMVRLMKDLPIRFYLKARYETAIALDANPTVNVDLGAQNIKIVQSTRQAPAFPTQSHPDVLGFISSDAGVTWAAANVTAVNFTTGVITLSKLAATNRVKVYYLPGNGEVELRAYRPVGSDAVSAKLFSQPLRSVHEVDQTNIRSALKLNIDRDVMLPSQFRLSLDVRSPSLIAWVAEAQHEIAIPVQDGVIEILDLQRLNVLAEQQMRGGNF